MQCPSSGTVQITSVWNSYGLTANYFKNNIKWMCCSCILCYLCKTTSLLLQFSSSFVWKCPAFIAIKSYWYYIIFFQHTLLIEYIIFLENDKMLFSSDLFFLFYNIFLFSFYSQNLNNSIDSCFEAPIPSNSR